MCARWLLITNLALVAMAQLPPGAVVIERASVRADRELVLWMVKPERFNRGPNTEDNPYVCPDRSRGHHYTGPTRVSLVDRVAKRIVNTVSLHSGDADSFDVPYLIRPNHSDYPVPGTAAAAEGKPALLRLRDVNGDGLALEAVFYDVQACMGVLTTLIGYSPKQDRVVRYPVELRVTDGGKTRMETQVWADYLFSQKPVSPGHWKYEIDYRGRAGSLNAYDIRYVPAEERFRGTLVWTEIP